MLQCRTPACAQVLCSTLSFSFTCFVFFPYVYAAALGASEATCLTGLVFSFFFTDRAFPSPVQGNRATKVLLLALSVRSLATRHLSVRSLLCVWWRPWVWCRNITTCRQVWQPPRGSPELGVGSPHDVVCNIFVMLIEI